MAGPTRPGIILIVQTVTVTEAKASLSRLVQQVLDGEEVAIGRRGRPEIVLRRYVDGDQ